MRQYCKTRKIPQGGERFETNKDLVGGAGDGYVRRWVRASETLVAFLNGSKT